MTESAFVDELIDAIKDAVEAGEGGSTEPELNALANQIVSVLAQRDGATIRDTFQKVEACFTEIVTRNGAPRAVFDERALTDELRSYVRMLAVAVQRLHPDEARMDDIKLTPTDFAILRALAQAGSLSVTEVVARVDAVKETVSRRLPLLRLHELVASSRRGKATMNKITPAGRQALANLPATPPNQHKRTNSGIALAPIRSSAA